jgi:uncharacterized protein YoxC
VISDGVLSTIISAIGAIMVVYITYRLKNMRPKSERIDTAFDILESTVRNLDKDNQRLREENTLLRGQLEAKQHDIDLLRGRL